MCFRKRAKFHYTIYNIYQTKTVYIVCIIYWHFQMQTKITKLICDDSFSAVVTRIYSRIMMILCDVFVFRQSLASLGFRRYIYISFVTDSAVNLCYGPHFIGLGSTYFRKSAEIERNGFNDVRYMWVWCICLVCQSSSNYFELINYVIGSI